jgi:hypothetical protein
MKIKYIYQNCAPYVEWPAEWLELYRLVFAGRFSSEKDPTGEITWEEQEILAALIPPKELKYVLFEYFTPSEKASFEQNKNYLLKEDG